MKKEPVPTLSVCLRCRDGRETEYDDVRGGTRLASAICDQARQQGLEAHLRGVHCMSQCKRFCTISLTAPGAFTYSFGDLDPEEPAHVQAILDLLPCYRTAPEGFLRREQRPEALRSSILSRLPPIGTESDLTTDLHIEGFSESR